MKIVALTAVVTHVAEPLLVPAARTVVGERPRHRQRPSTDAERLGRQPRPVAVVGGAQLDVERVRPQLGEQGPRPVRAGGCRDARDDDPQPGARCGRPVPRAPGAGGRTPTAARTPGTRPRSPRPAAARRARHPHPRRRPRSAGVIGVGAGSPDSRRRKKPPTPLPGRRRGLDPPPPAAPEPSPGAPPRAVASSSSGTSTSAMKSRSVHSTSQPIRLRVTTPSTAPDAASTSSSTGSRNGIRG